MRSESFLEMRRRNALAIVAIVRSNEEISRADLARAADLSPATVSSIVDDLLNSGVLIETGSKASARGRRPIGLCFNPRTRYVAGISIEYGKLALTLCDLDGSPLGESSGEYSEYDEPSELAASVADMLKELARECGAPFKKIAALGVALPSPIFENGAWQAPGHDNGDSHLSYRELCASLQQRFKCSVICDSYVNGAAIAESVFGLANASDSTMLIRVGDHVRSALVIDGQLYTGQHELAGELGHIPVPGNLRPCFCGSKGCINTLAANSFMVELCRTQGLRIHGVGEIVSQAKAGNTVCRELIEHAAQAVGYGAAVCLNMLAPRQVVLSGMLLEAEALFQIPLHASIRKYALKANLRNCVISASELKHKPEPLGVAIKALSTDPRLLLAGTPSQLPVEQFRQQLAPA